MHTHLHKAHTYEKCVCVSFLTINAVCFDILLWHSVIFMRLNAQRIIKNEKEEWKSERSAAGTWFFGVDQ